MIIHLEKGELLFIEKDKVVCETGDYESQEMVPVGDTDNPMYPPNFPLYQYPAIYVKYGVFNEE
jgi:hypothetical protein